MATYNLNSARFVKIPLDLLFKYTLIPGYKAEMTHLYGLIAQYYNEEEGCAWPNIDTLALYYGKSSRTTSDHIDALEACGLIRVEIDGIKKKFIPIPPISDDDEFFAAFPMARAELQRRLEHRESERKRSAEKIARMRRKDSEQSADIADVKAWL